jgi:hypothetical protein
VNECKEKGMNKERRGEIEGSVFFSLRIEYNNNNVIIEAIVSVYEKGINEQGYNGWAEDKRFLLRPTNTYSITISSPLTI